MTSSVPYYTDKYTCLSECQRIDIEPAYSYFLGRIYKKTLFKQRSMPYILKSLKEYKHKFMSIAKDGDDFSLSYSGSNKFILSEHFIRGFYEQGPANHYSVNLKSHGKSITDALGVRATYDEENGHTRFSDPLTFFEAIYKTDDALVSTKHYSVFKLKKSAALHENASVCPM